MKRETRMKLLAILIVLFMIFAGFVAFFYSVN
jgi:hypothetical protein